MLIIKDKNKHLVTISEILFGLPDNCFIISRHSFNFSKNLGQNNCQQVCIKSVKLLPMFVFIIVINQDGSLLVL